MDSVFFEHPNYAFDNTVVQNISGQIKPSGKILYIVYGYKKPTYLTLDIPTSLSNKIAKDSVDLTVKIMDNQIINDVEYLTNNSKRHVLLSKKNEHLFEVKLPISSIRNGYIILNQSDSILFDRSEWGQTVYINKHGINAVSSETNRANISNYLALTKAEKIKQHKIDNNYNRIIDRYKDSLVSCRGNDVPIIEAAPLLKKEPFYCFIYNERTVSLIVPKEEIISKLSSKLKHLQIKKQGVISFKIRVYFLLFYRILLD